MANDSSAPERRTRVEKGIYRRADGAYEIGWRDAQGKQRWRRVQGGLRAARAAYGEAIAHRARGERVGDPRLTFNGAADAWLASRVERLRPSTQSAYGAALKHVRAALGQRRLTDIQAADVAAYIARRQSAGAKGWTIKGELTVISGTFKYASRHMSYAGPNPVAQLDRVERPSTDDEKPKRILTAAERDRLLAAVNEPYRLLFTTAAMTGGRLGEVLGLTWGDVDLEEDALTFAYQLDNARQRVPLKTKRSRRCIDIAPGLSAGLREHKLRAPRSGRHDLVFVSRMGTPHDRRNVAGRVLRRAVERAGLGAIERDGSPPVPAPTFHDLRHTHASELIADGWDIVEVSSRLGHSSVEITMRTYAHEYDAANRSDERKRRLAAMEARMEAQPGPGRHETPPTTGGEVRQLRG